MSLSIKVSDFELQIYIKTLATCYLALATIVLYNDFMPTGRLNDFGTFLKYVDAKQRRWQFFVNIVTFVAAIILFSLIANLPAFKLRWTWHWHSQSISKIATGTITANPQAPPSTAPQVAMIEKDDSVVIDKIGVDAPIVWQGTGANVQELLEKGVVHIAGTAMPGSLGNVFLTGHSSDYWWTSGGNKTVFALLDKVDTGDDIKLYYRNQEFDYRIYRKVVVSADEVGDFVTTDKDQSLTLMTCYPIGTNWKRLMVQAERI